MRGENLSRERVEQGEYDPFLPEVPELTKTPALAKVPTGPATTSSDSTARLRQRRKQLRDEWRERHLGPQGETKSLAIVGRIRMIPLEKIVADTDFKNEMRLDATEEETKSLRESMRHEGLKTPVAVIEHAENYHLRWGFRRTKAARALGWEAIPAIVLPPDTPLPTQYWSNIVENLARGKMHTYEIALAAQVMKDKFRVDYREFARKTGYEPKYIDNLLRTIDNLPPDLLQRWRERRPIPVDYFIKWASMRPDEAVQSFDTYVGLHPHAQRVANDPADRPELRKKRRDYPLLMTTRAGLKRMDRLRFSIASHRGIDEATRTTWLAIVDFCMGQRSDVPGVHDEDDKQKSHKGRDGKRAKNTQTDVANFRLVAPGEPVEVDSAKLDQLEASVRLLGREQAERLMNFLKKTR